MVADSVAAAGAWMRVAFKVLIDASFSFKIHPGMIFFTLPSKKTISHSCGVSRDANDVDWSSGPLPASSWVDGSAAIKGQRLPALMVSIGGCLTYRSAPPPCLTLTPSGPTEAKCHVCCFCPLYTRASLRHQRLKETRLRDRLISARFSHACPLWRR